MNIRKIFWMMGVLSVSVFAVWILQPEPTFEFSQYQTKTLLERGLNKAGRDEYFLNRFHDPSTGLIPEGVRQMELSQMSKHQTSKRFSAKTTGGNWREAGPNNIGGRVRSLVVDVTDSNVLIAGGVTGGIWRSTNRGVSWQQVVMPDQTASITTIAQDPRSGFENIWYAAGGERQGSDGDRSRSSRINGLGIYKSTDGGLSWSILPATANSQDNGVSPFGRVYRLVVQPTTGHVFFAATGFGVYRSTDEGASFSMTLPESGTSLPPEAEYPGSSWSDIVVHPNGRLFVAATESTFAEGNTPVHQTGLMFADGEGAPGDWQSVPFTTAIPTIGEFRVVVAIAPSNPNIAYVMDYSGNIPGGPVDPAVDPNRTRPGDQVRILRVNLATLQLQDRSASLPTFGNVEDENDALIFDVFVQGGYNMMISVKPDNENFVLIGATNLFRTRNGFNTQIVRDDWIGGYDALLGLSAGPNDNHPDIHSVTWDPSNPNGVYMTGDGGVYYAPNINASTFSSFWQDRNQGLNILQPFQVAFGGFLDQEILLAGSQDNGTPAMRFDRDEQNTVPQLIDASGGDGAFSQVGNGLFIVSSQRGNSRMFRPNFNNLSQSQSLIRLSPDDATEPSFLAVNAIDPSDGLLFYYAASGEFWRNSALDRFFYNEVDWEHLTQLDIENREISAFGISTAPEHVLYYAGSAFNQLAEVYRVADSSSSNPTRQAINVPNLPAGAFIHDIAVNPADGDELLIVVSNYNVESLYYSRDGGQSFQTVEGNLGDETDGAGNILVSGPSVRSATILPRQNTTFYLIATSTGVYSTETLAGSNTQWERESTDLIGSSVMSWIDSRPIDGRVVAASHGRGVFVLDLGESEGVDVELLLDEPVLGLSSDPARDGHGFELSKVGDSYLMLFYSYDLNGNPEWYLGLGDYTDGVFTSGGDSGNAFSRFTYDESRTPRQQAEPGSNGSIRLSYQATDVEAACNDGVERQGRMAAFEWEIEGESGVWCVAPTIPQRSDNPEYTGTWFAGEQDAGWGLSIQNEGSTLASVIYYYDSDGIGRWAIGAGQLTPSSDELTADLNMIEVRGYCRNCPLDRENRDAGSMRLDMSIPSRAMSNNGFGLNFNQVLTNVTYQNAPGGSWIRNTPIVILSNPR